MVINDSRMNTTVIAPSTMAANTTITDSPTIQTAKEIAMWINGLIIILGFITNSLILVILSRRRIGSQTTRVILMFLAATDLVIMLIELLIHYVPQYTRWFPIFYTDLGCGFGFFFQASLLTVSSWYLMLMTMERFTVVWFPMKAKFICTQKKVLVACILVPIISMVSYYYLVTDIGMDASRDYTTCRPKEIILKDGTAQDFRSRIRIWIVVYFFIPAAFIVLLNTTIVIRLAKAQKLQNRMSMRRSLKRSRKLSRTTSTTSAGSNSIKKATTLVVVASVTFVILMIPRGVSTMISLDASWDYSQDAEELLDIIAYLLQYLNHAINFFLYILSNNSFRNEMTRMWRCQSRKKNNHRQMRLKSLADTEMTQMTYVPPPHG